MEMHPSQKYSCFIKDTPYPLQRERSFIINLRNPLDCNLLQSELGSIDYYPILELLNLNN